MKTLTPYPEVNEILECLLAHLKDILQDQFVGMYLYGSLSSGDFSPEMSDLDFLVVTSGPLPEEIVSQLEAMHDQLWQGDMKWASKLEGAYVPRGLIRRHAPRGPACPTVNEEKFYVAPLGSDWIIQRHVVREYGVLLEGPQPAALIDFVSPQEIREAVLGILREWWFPMLDDPSWLQKHSRSYHSYAILTMCRALHALQHGTIVSKPVAAQWAKGFLDPKRSRVIDLALRARAHDAAEFQLLDHALEFIRYIKEVTTHELPSLPNHQAR